MVNIDKFIGKKFGHLTIIRENGFNKKNQRLVLCICDCGEYCTKSLCRIKVGKTSRCSGHCKGMSLKNWFYSQTKTEGDKILWTGKVYKTYGVTCYNCKVYFAHRLAWEIENGPIPNGLHVLHRNDTPLDVNVKNLFLGTNKDNINDMLAKHRNPIGEMQGNAKLEDEDVIKIRKLHKDGVNTPLELSKIFSVTRANIYRIINNKLWKHLL